MQFFSNKIYVNGGQKSFQDIINDVKGGMTKTAAKKDDVKKEEEKSATMQKTTKGGKMPKEVLENFKNKGKSNSKGDDGKSGASGDNSSGLTPAQKKLPPALRAAIAKKKGKKGKKKANDSSSYMKIASIDKVSDDEVILTLAQMHDEAAIHDEAEMHDEAAIHDEAMMSESGWSESASDEDEEEVVIDDSDEDKVESADCGSMKSEGCGKMPMASSDDSKLASSDKKFVKIANLTDKQKSNFRKYWEGVWPKEFIDAVLSTEN